MEAHRARALREGFLEVATVLASHNSVSAARGFATGTSAPFPGASGPVWPPGLCRHGSSDLWRTWPELCSLGKA